jgi:predicted phage baseplate assembly protein
MMTLHFGDGVHGRRLPTGRNNVSAVYRQGIGRAGLVNARAIATALDRPLGVKSVINPLASEGGAEAESPESVRVNAPATVRTFGRIVSLTDFEDAARAYAGIAKARAALVWEGDEQVVSLTVAGERGAAVTPGGVLFANLLADLDSRRDPHRSLRLGSYMLRPILLDVALLVDAPTFLPEDVEAAARAALVAFFDFDRLDLGQAVSTAEIHAALHAVAGVVAVDINRFVFKPPAGLTVAQRRQFYADRARLGAPAVSTLDSQGFPGVSADVQSFAAALPNELVGLADANADLTVTTTTRLGL